MKQHFENGYCFLYTTYVTIFEGSYASVDLWDIRS